MARRSARLRKTSPAPSPAHSNSSWETAPSHANSPAPNEPLPPVAEAAESVIKTPQKLVGSGNAKASQLPQPTGTPARTPKNRTPIKPTGSNMHPAHHHASTAKVLDEARWLGFQALGSHTAPPKQSSGLAAAQDTPSKTPARVAAAEDNTQSTAMSPDMRFRFRFKSPLSALSPTSSKILKESARKTATETRGLFQGDEATTTVDVTPKRKTAVPKGKIARFSDVHMKEFKKMDSIANHPSAFRAANVQLKSSLKTDSPDAEASAKTPNKLKRTQSKIDVAEATPKAPASSLKRTQSKTNVTGTISSQQTIQAPQAPRDGSSDSQEPNPFAKRVKRSEKDDASTTRPAPGTGEPGVEHPAATPARKAMPKSALPRLASRLMTPTKSSIARSQSVKTLKSQSMIPDPFVRSTPSAKTLFSPTNIGSTVKDSVRDGLRKTSNSIQRVRSILRTPSRKFSEDPEKVAAGTHMSPSGWNLDKALPQAPKTAPIKKHVNFTSITLERAAWDDVGKSPSPVKFRAGSEVPTGAVIYPTLGSTVEYPTIPKDDKVDQESNSPSRRLTFGGPTATTPSKFSFKSDKPIKFGPPSTGTIRMVRPSDASSIAEGKKRKLDTVTESSDKENSEPPQVEQRSAKKARMEPTEAPQTPSKSASKLPRHTPRGGGSISKSRLAFLATPKRGRA